MFISNNKNQDWHSSCKAYVITVFLFLIMSVSQRSYLTSITNCNKVVNNNKSITISGCSCTVLDWRRNLLRLSQPLLLELRRPTNILTWQDATLQNCRLPFDGGGGGGGGGLRKLLRISYREHKTNDYVRSLVRMNGEKNMTYSKM